MVAVLVYMYHFLAGIVLFALILSILMNQAFLQAYKVGMHARVTLSAAIYQKILTLSQVTIGRLSIGHVVNLASNDVHRLDMVGHNSPNIPLISESKHMLSLKMLIRVMYSQQYHRM